MPDNYDLFRRHEAEQERQLDRLPRCVYCDEPIQDEKGYHLDDEWWHEECFNDQFLKSIEDYID